MRYRIVSNSYSKNKKYFQKIKSILDQDHVYSEDDFEYLFVIGGDGTFIHFVKKYAFENKKIIGIGTGSVSFLSSINLKEKFDVEGFEFSDLELLKIEGKHRFYAFNDVYLGGELLLDFHININEVYIQRFRGSGFLFSTKSGSTAKNKSFRGPILFPKTRSWIAREIGGQTAKKFKSLDSPMIVSGEETFELRFLKKPYRLYVDGHFVPENSTSLSVSLVLGTSKIVCLSIENYLEKLKGTFLK